MSEFFVRRPIVAIVIAILMTLIGGVCILALPIAQYPQIAPPEIQVQTHYTGADALTIEQSVAAPIEQQMSGVDNMNYMYSLNSTADGLMRLIVDYDVKTDPNTDLMLTQLRQTQAANSVLLAATCRPISQHLQRVRFDSSTRSAMRDQMHYAPQTVSLSQEAAGIFSRRAFGRNSGKAGNRRM